MPEYTDSNFPAFKKISYLIKDYINKNPILSGTFFVYFIFIVASLYSSFILGYGISDYLPWFLSLAFVLLEPGVLEGFVFILLPLFFVGSFLMNKFIVFISGGTFQQHIVLKVIFYTIFSIIVFGYIYAVLVFSKFQSTLF
ncbi:MAG: hypothetical protein Q7S12_00415 [bacterium]|nr:hypothetical protein [bacterium]